MEPWETREEPDKISQNSLLNREFLFYFSKYSGDLNNEHLNIRNIWIADL